MPGHGIGVMFGPVDIAWKPFANALALGYSAYTEAIPLLKHVAVAAAPGSLGRFCGVHWKSLGIKASNRDVDAAESGAEGEEDWGFPEDEDWLPTTTPTMTAATATTATAATAPITIFVRRLGPFGGGAPTDGGRTAGGIDAVRGPSHVGGPGGGA
jgi:hypothetical protein